MVRRPGRFHTRCFTWNPLTSGIAVWPFQSAQTSRHCPNFMWMDGTRAWSLPADQEGPLLRSRLHRGPWSCAQSRMLRLVFHVEQVVGAASVPRRTCWRSRSSEHQPSVSRGTVTRTGKDGGPSSVAHESGGHGRVSRQPGEGAVGLAPTPDRSCGPIFT